MGDKTPLYKSKDKEMEKITQLKAQGKASTCKSRGKKKNRERLN